MPFTFDSLYESLCTYDVYLASIKIQKSLFITCCSKIEIPRPLFRRSHLIFMQCRFKLQKEAETLCVECCDYTTELFTHSIFQFIGKKAFQRRLKESLWRSMKMVFGSIVTYVKQTQ